MRKYLILVPGTVRGVIQWASGREAAGNGAALALGLPSLPEGSRVIAIPMQPVPARFRGYDAEGLAIYSGVQL